MKALLAGTQDNCRPCTPANNAFALRKRGEPDGLPPPQFNIKLVSGNQSDSTVLLAVPNQANDVLTISLNNDVCAVELNAEVDITFLKLCMLGGWIGIQRARMSAEFAVCIKNKSKKIKRRCKKDTNEKEQQKSILPLLRS